MGWRRCSPVHEQRHRAAAGASPQHYLGVKPGAGSGPRSCCSRYPDWSQGSGRRRGPWNLGPTSAIPGLRVNPTAEGRLPRRTGVAARPIGETLEFRLHQSRHPRSASARRREVTLDPVVEGEVCDPGDVVVVGEGPNVGGALALVQVVVDVIADRQAGGAVLLVPHGLEVGPDRLQVGHEGRRRRPCWGHRRCAGPCRTNRREVW